MHALSFDVEDWFHISGIPHVERRGNWDSFSSSIVEDKTNLILEILNRYDVKATFFVLGWIAKKYPVLVQRIAEEGHEIGTHGYWHYRVNTLSKERFKDYLQQSVDILEKVTEKKVKGYRAPSFSITPGTEWAFEVMEEVGLQYDASLFPAQRGHGGYAIDQKPQILDTSITPTNFLQLPMSVMDFGKIKIPFSGGGYLRFWHEKVLRFGFNRLEKEGIPGVIYLHPRDFAPNCRRVKMSPIRKFKCYVNLHTTQRKLEMLLENYEFDTCEHVLKEWFQVKNLIALKN
jgi:polysaccharide deacetylase family protein (PEP-CTERM system associated)